jgi:hypothetical protein
MSKITPDQNRLLIALERQMEAKWHEANTRGLSIDDFALAAIEAIVAIKGRYQLGKDAKTIRQNSD